MWHTKSLDDLRSTFSVNPENGLSFEQAEKRQREYGKNVFVKGEEDSIFDIIFRQLKSPLIIVLVIAGLATLFLKEFSDATVIFIAVGINIAIGTFQEFKAGKAFKELEATLTTHAVVLRDGMQKNVLAEELVPGDIIILSSGHSVPADARIIESDDLETNEAALTGEWKEVPKSNITYSKKAPIHDQHNMVFMGTNIVAGSGRAMVVATGKNTEVGKIAKTLGYVAEDTPFQKSIRSLAKLLVYIIVVVLIIIFALGIYRGESLTEVLLVAIALAVSAIPEGLPIAVTVVLAFGMREILKRGGLVRNLLAAETLGSTTIILTDKTGTLTEAKMELREVVTFDDSKEDREKVLSSAVLSSDAFIESVGQSGEPVVSGRPVEKAIVLGGFERGFDQRELKKEVRELDVLPFASKRRFAATIHKLRIGNEIHVVGAPEVILRNAKFVLRGGKYEDIKVGDLDELYVIQENFAKDGLRLVAVGLKDTDLDEFPGEERESEESSLKGIAFAGFLVLHDPVREDVPEAIKKAMEAGVRVLMMTGDHAGTALSIAKDSGIVGRDETRVLTGSEVAMMEDEQLLNKLNEVSVFARMRPDQKMRVATLLKGEGEVVAMTGDGINDAPALRNADIGVAVGSGTDVAKEASDLVLVDNSFRVIVSAIEEGRRILDNLKKISVYLLATSFSEIAIVGVALLIGVPLPVLPVQILWANVVQEGFMNFAFAFEPKEGDLMKRNPKSKDMRVILSSKVKKIVAVMGASTSIIAIATYLFLLNSTLSIETIRTVVFGIISMGTIFFAFSLKNLYGPIWKTNFLSNKYLMGAFCISTSLFLLAIFWPPLQRLLSVEALSLPLIALVVGVGLLNLFVIEIVKWFVFAAHYKKEKA